MGPAPQPPHERAWRHPSELAPTAVDIDPKPGSGRALVVATGLAAIMMAAVMVVALTPPTSSAPTAVGATTLPALTVQLRSPSVQSSERETTAREIESVRIGRNMMSKDNALALVGSPNAISAAPAVTDSLDVAEREPADDDRVYVLTRSYTYSVRWTQVERIAAPDGSVVITAGGELLATFVSGELRVLID